MSIARHHAEWLSLVEVSGPFLSLPVLLRAFPQGLPARDPELSKEAKLMFADWLDGHRDRAVHIGWCNFVLRSVLKFPPEVIREGPTIPPGMEARMSEYGEVLRPTMAILSPTGSASTKARMLIQIVTPSQDLEKPLSEKHWKASPSTRMTELLHAADVPLGLITNGEDWMLVHAPRGETSGFASWYAPLWFEEPLTFQAFVGLLSVQRFFGVPDDQTIEALLNASAKDQQEVTEQLGWQVRKAVEVLIQSFDKIDQDHNRKLLEGVGEKQLYEAALTVMMRLVFLMCAEERKILFPSDCKDYQDFYAISTLREQLQEVADKHVEEVLDTRFDAWGRLLATFRAIYGGVQHEAMRLPPYGGTLFDADRFPFLEGRKANTSWRTEPADPLKVSNRTVLHLLNALQILQMKVPGGGAAEARRISFRALDIEQIGHVYEGLLDHTAKRAMEPVLGLKGGKDKEPEIALSKLEELAGGKPTALYSAAAETADPFLLAAETPGNVIPLPTGKGNSSYGPPEKLVEFLKAETGRSVNAITRELTDQSGVDEGRLLIACGHDRELLDRVWRFAALLRDDTFGFAVVIPTSSVYVTQGSDRRSTGTHYTPRSLTEPIVQHTLEPLVYIGPAEGTPREQWKLKSAREILALKVCDMAMGSGAFLVQTCRYLAERLVEAWENVEREHPGCFVITPEGELSTGSPGERLLPKDPAERLTIARRFVADRCLYGVDINPMAVEMAKLSLWLITLQKDRPFTFLDHALRCGDSLLGVSSVKQIENFSLRAKEGERVQHTFATATLFRYVDEATEKRRALENLPSNDHTQIETKNSLHTEAEAATAMVKALADCLTAFELRGLGGEAYEEQRAVAADHAEVAMRKPLPEFQAYAREQLHGRRAFHWMVEFPEVFARGGFDAFVGNPPFLGGARISGTIGPDYLDYLLATHPKAIGNADLSSFFVRRAYSQAKDSSVIGLLTTNSIAKGETRESALDYLVKGGAIIIRAARSRHWPGTANVFISDVFLRKGTWLGECVLDGLVVGRITSFLDDHAISFEPFRLAENRGLVFRGPSVGGEGFILTRAEAEEILTASPDSRGIIKRFLTGQDINQNPQQKSDRFAIDLGDRDEGEASKFTLCWQRLYNTVRLQRQGNRMQGRVTFWWQFTGRQEKLYEAISGFKRVLVCGEVSKYWCATWVDATHIFSGKVIVFALRTHADFAVLNSCFHSEWAEKTASRLKDDPSYSLANTFETLPVPRDLLVGRAGGAPALCAIHFLKLDGIGERYQECRRQAMLARQEGLTTIYNRFHDPGEKSDDIAHLRALHVEMDQAVAAAYGWSDFDLGHGFHETKQGVRYTISETARRTVLDRLLALNHERYAEEVKAGQHDKGAKKGKRAKPSGAARVQGNCVPPPQGDLFG